MSESQLPEIEIDPSDPMLRPAQTFPRLNPDMVARVAAFGNEEEVDDGTLVFERGQRNADFILILEGSIEIFDVDLDDRVNMVTVLGERQFTGEIDLLNDRPLLVNGRTRGASRIARIKRPDFRRMVTAEPEIAEIIMRAFILRRVGLLRRGLGGVVLVGRGHGGDTLRLQRFLTRNAYPHRLFDAEAEADAAGFLAHFDLSEEKLPVVISGHTVLRNPSNSALADALGLTGVIDSGHVHDVAVVGAGPAGLASGVYASSEGLDTVIVEALAPGGQAGTSSKIENYLGFPTGISGEALAGRAQVQAQKFGARLLVSRPVTGLDCGGDVFALQLEDGIRIEARAVVIATGAHYRTLDVANYARFEGQGIHYAATAMEGRLCANEEVAVIGGGNSAGQAAVFLSRQAKHVYMLVRGPRLADGMSDYLVQRIEASPRITLLTETEITGLEGETSLERVTWTHRRTRESQTCAMRSIFVMIGAVPNTEWVADCLARDGKGFLLTGAEAARGTSCPYATSRAGIWAVGDVRAGSVKRVASAVGEGSVVVQSIHRFLNPDVA